MKTLKLMFVALFATLTMVSFAQGTAGKSKPVNDVRSGPVNDVKGIAIRLPLDYAQTLPQLAQAMTSQISLGTIHSKKGGVINIGVKTDHEYYIISGTFEEWLRWFRLRVVKLEGGNKIID